MRNTFNPSPIAVNKNIEYRNPYGMTITGAPRIVPKYTIFLNVRRGKMIEGEFEYTRFIPNTFDTVNFFNPISDLGKLASYFIRDDPSIEKNVCNYSSQDSRLNYYQYKITIEQTYDCSWKMEDARCKKIYIKVEKNRIPGYVEIKYTIEKDKGLINFDKFFGSSDMEYITNRILYEFFVIASKILDSSQTNKYDFWSENDEEYQYCNFAVEKDYINKGPDENVSFQLLKLNPKISYTARKCRVKNIDSTMASNFIKYFDKAMPKKCHRSIVYTPKEFYLLGCSYKKLYHGNNISMRIAENDSAFFRISIDYPRSADRNALIRFLSSTMIDSLK